MKKTILVMIVIVITTGLFAMDYGTGVGVRGGLSNGITVKHFINNKTAIEGLLSSRWGGLNITGLYEIHNAAAFDVPRLNWYYGVGAHIGFWSGKDVGWADDEKDYTVIGIDGIIGIEYNFEELPFNIGLDWKPAFNLTGNTEFWGDGGALSLRFVF